MPEILLSSSCLVIVWEHFGKLWAHSVAIYGYGIKRSKVIPLFTHRKIVGGCDALCSAVRYYSSRVRVCEAGTSRDLFRLSACILLLSHEFTGWLRF